jgi:hypothetical protein
MVALVQPVVAVVNRLWPNTSVAAGIFDANLNALSYLSIRWFPLSATHKVPEIVSTVHEAGYFKLLAESPPLFGIEAMKVGWPITRLALAEFLVKG